MKCPKNLQRAIDSGFRLSSVKLHSAADNSKNIPETHYSEKSENASRRAKIWWTPAAVVIEQDGKYIVTSLANAIGGPVKEDDESSEDTLWPKPEDQGVVVVEAAKRRGRPKAE